MISDVDTVWVFRNGRPHNSEDGKIFPGWVNCRVSESRELWEKVSEYRTLYEGFPRFFEGEEVLWEP